jgi:adenine/guanine phosphoribosyltransferase-like PRPP-binding protein
MVYHTVRHPLIEPYAHSGSFADLEAAVELAVAAVTPHLDEFDVIAVQGTSGMSIGFPLALAVGKPIVVARKPQDVTDDFRYCHDRCLIVGNEHDILKDARVLFVDDFVSSGETRLRVQNAVKQFGGKIVAQYMSRDDDFYSRPASG